MPPGVDLAAYRIVQEALTSVIRHSNAHQAHVSVWRRGGELEIVVEDSGPRKDGTSSSGHGLVGMQERAQLYCGRVEVVGEAEDGMVAVEMARRLLPGVVVMDMRMPRLDGIEATRRILASPGQKPRVLILTTFDGDEFVYQALRSGAGGFLLKTAPPDQLVEGVRLVASGEALLSPSVTRRLINSSQLSLSPWRRRDRW